MSDKPRDRLNELDRLLREARPVVGFSDTHVQLTIEKVCGFELFNTRPYHNYETWADGYRVFDDEVFAKAEDLDDAVRLYHERRRRLDAGGELQAFERPRPKPAEAS